MSDPIVKSKAQCGRQEGIDSDNLLNEIFRNISQAQDVSEGYVFLDSSKSFKMAIPKRSIDYGASDDSLAFGELLSKRFKVPADFSFMQLKVELFYDPSLYDLELTLYSLKNQDSEESSGFYYSSPSRQDSGKGSKMLYLEVEPGIEYEMRLTYLVPQLESWESPVY